MSENPSGIRFPFTFAGAGGVRKSKGADKVASNLEALVTTALQERLVRKSVGTVGYQIVLRNVDEISRRAIKGLVWEAIVRHERRVRLLSLDVTSNDTEDGRAIFVEGRFIFKQTGEESTFTTQIA